jgi:hypothetical protein
LVVFAVKVTGTPEQTVLVAVEIVTAGELLALTVMVILLELAVVVVAQLTLEVKTQLITSLLANEVLEYVDELTPTLLPFSFHW